MVNFALSILPRPVVELGLAVRKRVYAEEIATARLETDPKKQYIHFVSAEVQQSIPDQEKLNKILNIANVLASDLKTFFDFKPSTSQKPNQASEEEIELFKSFVQTSIIPVWKDFVSNSNAQLSEYWNIDNWINYSSNDFMTDIVPLIKSDLEAAIQESVQNTGGVSLVNYLQTDACDAFDSLFIDTAKRIYERSHPHEVEQVKGEAAAQIAKIFAVCSLGAIFAFSIMNGQLSFVNGLLSTSSYGVKLLNFFASSGFVTRCVVLSTLSLPATLLAAGTILATQAVATTALALSAISFISAKVAFVATAQILMGNLPQFILGYVLIQNYKKFKIGLLHGSLGVSVRLKNAVEEVICRRAKGASASVNAFTYQYESLPPTDKPTNQDNTLQAGSFPGLTRSRVSSLTSVGSDLNNQSDGVEETKEALQEVEDEKVEEPIDFQVPSQAVQDESLNAKREQLNAYISLKNHFNAVLAEAKNVRKQCNKLDNDDHDDGKAKLIKNLKTQLNTLDEEFAKWEHNLELNDKWQKLKNQIVVKIKHKTQVNRARYETIINKLNSKIQELSDQIALLADLE